MPSRYATIKTQLKTDIRAVFGNNTKIIFGSARREVLPETGKPFVQIKTDENREFEGPRRVREDYTFNMECRFIIPDASELEDGDEPYLMEKARLIIDTLSPNDTSVPAVAGPYAGVGSIRSCTKPKVVDTTDEDGYIAFSFEFYLETTVYQ